VDMGLPFICIPGMDMPPASSGAPNGATIRTSLVPANARR
jgi:hypothetical protein